MLMSLHVAVQHCQEKKKAEGSIKVCENEDGHGKIRERKTYTSVLEGWRGGLKLGSEKTTRS